jgi:hypothetical protein
MSQTEVDGGLAAFDGFLFAWMLAKMPELYGPLSLEDQHFRRYVVLRHQGNKVELLVPRVFAHVDSDWAQRQPEAGE